MDFLNLIPESAFETVGVFAGLAGCFVIGIQVRKEYKTKMPSSLSMGFIVGWIFIYFFWGLYGVRFGTIALWFTNSIAVILQILLFVIVIKKRKKISETIE